MCGGTPKKNPADARPEDPPHSSVVVVVHNATMPFELPTPAAEFCGNGGGLTFHSHRIHGTGIFTYIYHKNQPNVGKYTIHGSYGSDYWLRKNKDPDNDGLLMCML